MKSLYQMFAKISSVAILIGGSIYFGSMLMPEKKHIYSNEYDQPKEDGSNMPLFMLFIMAVALFYIWPTIAELLNRKRKD